MHDGAGLGLEPVVMPFPDAADGPVDRLPQGQRGRGGRRHRDDRERVGAEGPAVGEDLHGPGAGIGEHLATQVLAGGGTRLGEGVRAQQPPAQAVDAVAGGIEDDDAAGLGLDPVVMPFPGTADGPVDRLPQGQRGRGGQRHRDDRERVGAGGAAVGVDLHGPGAGIGEHLATQVLAGGGTRAWVRVFGRSSRQRRPSTQSPVASRITTVPGSASKR